LRRNKNTGANRFHDFNRYSLSKNWENLLLNIGPKGRMGTITDEQKKNVSTKLIGELG